MIALQGFDEFMNVVLDEADEVWIKDSKTKKTGDRAKLGTSSMRSHTSGHMPCTSP